MGSKYRMRNVISCVVILSALMSPGSALADVCKVAADLSTRVAAAISVGGSSLGVGLKVAGVSAVAHSSGATILTASTGYLSGTLGAVGAIGGVLMTPATLVVGGLTLAGGIGAFYYCR